METDQGRIEPEAGRVAVQGIAVEVSLGSLRALLDPATREAATIDLDLRDAHIEIPAAALHDVVARFVPGVSLELRDDGLTLRPGGGAPGLRMAGPDDGVRVHIGQHGLRVESD